MCSIDTIKNKIITRVDELLTNHLKLFIETNKFSSSELGNLIGKLINEEVNIYRSTIIKKKEIKKSKDPPIITDISEYNIYMKNNIAKLKDFYKDKKNILEIFEEVYNNWKKIEKK